MPGSLPGLPQIAEIRHRLAEIFPEGLERRGYVTREMAAKTAFVFLYAGAIERSDRWLRPSHVYFMTTAQAAKRGDEQRQQWYRQSLAPRYRPAGKRWYADNSREPIRDETIRQGFTAFGAVIEREGIAVTASTPKYALARDFAALLDPQLRGPLLSDAIARWQKAHLSKSALSRVALVKAGAAKTGSAITVKFPNGETRNLAAGPSAPIAQAVVERFAPRFLRQPTVLWLSESGNKVVARDDRLAGKIGFTIDPARALPDIILVDLESASTDILIVFVEVVATDGPINQLRRDALSAIANEAGFDAAHVAFVTAFADRGAPAFRKCVADLAWGTYAWFASEPEKLVILRNGEPTPISSLARLADRQ
jgi:hypothetical protein